MLVGIIGLKFTGKTTLFNVLTASRLPTGQGGVEPHRAMGVVPDRKLDHLSCLYRPRRTTHTRIEWVDVPGFAPEPGREAEREATRFLEHARRMDALVQVVRCFDGGYGAPDPSGELTTVALELILADLQIVERRLDKLHRDRQLKGRLDLAQEPDLLQRLRGHLEGERPLRDLPLTPEERRMVSGFGLLTLKPLLVALNHAEGDPPAAGTVAAAERIAGAVVALCAAVESDLADLDEDELPEYLEGLGMDEPVTPRMIRAVYQAMHLNTFYTVSSKECRAWTVPCGSLAPAAAGVIHSDMERGFIRAEVLAFDDLLAAGSHAAAKAAGKVRLEGKGYEVRDGDIIEIRFSV